MERALTALSYQPTIAVVRGGGGRSRAASSHAGNGSEAASIRRSRSTILSIRSSSGRNARNDAMHLTNDLTAGHTAWTTDLHALLPTTSLTATASVAASCYLSRPCRRCRIVSSGGCGGGGGCWCCERREGRRACRGRSLNDGDRFHRCVNYQHGRAARSSSCSHRRAVRREGGGSNRRGGTGAAKTEPPPFRRVE